MQKSIVRRGDPRLTMTAKHLLSCPFVSGSGEGIHPCIFSPCRRYRYVLKCRWDDSSREIAIAWIGLNPSTADEWRLDPTLTRIKGFSASFGFNCFYMLNLFAFRATCPDVMKTQTDPIGAENDRHILDFSRKCKKVVACWGTHGTFLHRNKQVQALLYSAGVQLQCLGKSKAGHPLHPLYQPATSRLVRYPLPLEKGTTAHRK